MSATLVTPPAVEPVSLQMAKDHLRVTQDDEDALITRYLVGAREIVERETSAALITQTWVAGFAAHGCWRLPRWPVQQILQVVVQTPDGGASDIDLTDLALSRDGPWMTLVPLRPLAALVPDGIARIPEPIAVAFVAGYGDAAADVPDLWTQAILLLVAQRYEFREPVVAGRIPTEIPWTVQQLLAVVSPPAVGV